MAKSSATALVHALASTRAIRGSLLKNDIHVVEVRSGAKWRRVFCGRRGAIGKTSAMAEAKKLRKQYPQYIYRVRKLRRSR